MPDEATISIEEATVAPRRRLTIDLATSYALSLSRVAAWAIVSKLIVDRAGLEALGLVALIRGTLNLANYLPSAITPTLVQGYQDRTAAARPLSEAPPASPSIEYQRRLPVALTRRDPATAAALACAFVVALLGTMYVNEINDFHGPFNGGDRWQGAQDFAFASVASAVLRIVGEPIAARLQVSGRLSIDNVALAVAEWLWVLTVTFGKREDGFAGTLASAGVGLVVGQIGALAIRFFADPSWRRSFVCGPTFIQLAAITYLLYLGQLADYLYGSTNQIVIDRALGRGALAAYVPCLQIDSALLLIVSGIGVALFPRLAFHAKRDDHPAIRRDYLVGTLVSLTMLVVASIAAWTLAPFAIRHWLGVIPAGTLAILPLVLIHTVVGGTAGIGRAVLLGMGRFKAYTVSALVGGVANVLLALLFVLGFGWGLRGVVFATIVAVVGRCAIWMPWYILRALRDPAAQRPA